jgi:hypothetical protein
MKKKYRIFVALEIIPSQQFVVVEIITSQFLYKGQKSSLQQYCMPWYQSLIPAAQRNKVERIIN